MKVMLTGAGGQLGWELARTVPSGIELTSLDLPHFDIRNSKQTDEAVKSLRPDWIINTAAYTAVDQAEVEPSSAFKVNRDAVAGLAGAARQYGARMIHFSTDFIFDGRKSTPYKPEDPPNPLGVYGTSKLEGERLVLGILRDFGLVIRTAWLYSAHGHNFVKTMLRLMEEKEEVRVVADQIGTPTWAKTLAEFTWKAMEGNLSGVYHWTDGGAAGWYDFAVAIQEEAWAIKMLGRLAPIIPITTKEFPVPAKRPPYSILDKTRSWEAVDCDILHWRVALRRMLKELSHV